jgi:hypothetical protein
MAAIFFAQGLEAAQKRYIRMKIPIPVGLSIDSACKKMYNKK